MIFAHSFCGKYFTVSTSPKLIINNPSHLRYLIQLGDNLSLSWIYFDFQLPKTTIPKV